MIYLNILKFTKSYFLMLIVMGVVGVGSFSACKKKKDDSISKGTYQLTLPADSSIIAYIDKNHTKPVTDLAKIEKNTIVYLKAVADNVAINNLDIDNGSLTNGANMATVTMNANKNVTSTINTDGFTFNGNTLNSYRGSFTKIFIPNVYNGTTITTIGDGTPSRFGFGFNVTNIIIPNSVTTISQYAFEECISLRSITIPNSVTTIGDKAFSYCVELRSITLGNSVTSIGIYAVSFCHLTSVTIPNSVTNIGVGAFSNNPALTSVTMQSTTPPTSEYGSGMFEFNNIDTFEIYVPNASLNAYKTASGWSDYASQIKGY